jgi:hypothetical protein
MANEDLKPGVRADEITMMSTPGRWPYLALPLKRDKPGTSFRETGTLVAVEGFQTYVFLTFVFHGQAIMDQITYIHEHGEPDPEGIQFEKYDSFEDLVDDGWSVD